MIRWYICPYDIKKDEDLGEYRECAMRRYLPKQMSVISEWEEVEILGNHTLVKVDSSDNIYNEIDKDSDFINVETVSTTDLKAKLIELHYTPEEIASDLTTLDNRLEMLEKAGKNRVFNNKEISDERKKWSRTLESLKDKLKT